MSMRSITALTRQCYSHFPVSQNIEFKQRLDFFKKEVFHQQPLLPRQPLMTAPPVTVRDIRGVFERMATGHSSQALQRETENPSQMFWHTSTRLSWSAPNFELQPLLAELSSSTDAQPISEKADKGKDKDVLSVKADKGKDALPVSVEEHRPVNDALVQQLEELCLQLNAKDDGDQCKRTKGHYFALQGQQLVWKPFHKEGKWQREERKEAKEAFLHLLDVLEQAAKSDIKVINDRFPDSEEFVEINLDLILEKVINKEWCKSLLTDEVVRKKCLDLIYLILFKGNLDSAHEVHSCLHEAGPALDTIVRILSSIQFKFVTEAMPDIYEKGLHQVGSLRVKTQTRLFERVLEKARSPVIREKMQQEFQRRLEIQKSYKIYQTGLSYLEDHERRDLFYGIGMEKVYEILPAEEHAVYLQDLILNHQDRITVFNSRSLIEISDNLSECQRLTNEELDLHRKWSEDPKKNLQKFIAETLTGRPKMRAEQALEDTNFGSVISEIFGTGNKMGNVREMLSASLLEVFSRSLSHLEPHLERSQLDAYEEKKQLFKGKINWNEMKPLFIQLAQDMEKCGLG